MREDAIGPGAASARLRASEERFRILVEGVRDYAIFMLDTEGRITTWNLGAERMKGYRAEEIIGRHFSVFYPEEARLVGHPDHELELAVRDGRYEEEGWRVRKDGTTFWANVVITALFDGDGRHVGFGKVTRDMTERRDLLQRTAQFVALTAHELRSPITAITGAAEILRSYWEELEPAERTESLDSILRGGHRIRRLLDDLILVSRLESRSFEFRVEDVALGPALAEALLELSDEVSDVKVSCAETLIVRADRTRVLQIVTNLVGNAARHGQPPIEIDARRHGAEVEVRVLDAGPGVPDYVEPRLFDRFVKGTPGDGGSGLGLFIVRELVVGQGGRVWYERDQRSEDAPSGSCFGFSLPLAAA